MSNNFIAKCISLLCIGRFHHFHLARELEKRNILYGIWTGYPANNLKDEDGISLTKINNFPWLMAPYMASKKIGFNISYYIDNKLSWLAKISLDKYASNKINTEGTLIALSSCGLISGRATKNSGGRYICDRGSTHIRFQDEILREEYAIWNLPYNGIDPRVINREESEYELADFVSVPSTFVFNSFISMGYPSEKLFLNQYGARLGRFYKISEPSLDSFTVVFVGQVSIRKGFLYLLEAFGRLVHPSKKLIVIGFVAPEIKNLLSRFNLSGVQFLGLVPNQDLPFYYSSAHVMVLPSIEEGLAMVIGESLACGCPVIATENSGAGDFFTDGIEGFIIEARNVDILADRLNAIMQDTQRRIKMSMAAVAKVDSIGGWDAYGDRWSKFLSN